jgi:hypothetical protein
MKYLLFCFLSVITTTSYRIFPNINTYSFIKYNSFTLKNSVYETTPTIYNNSNSNNTHHPTKAEIQQFIEYIKLKTFDCNEMENWDSGEIEWEF